MKKLLWALAALAALCLAEFIPAAHAGELQLVSVKKIWDGGPHNAFTDLIRFKGKWFCTFRESESHVRGDGQIRVLTSKNGDDWTSAALLAENGVDLRDPKFSITPNNRLMLTLGGTIHDGQAVKERRPRVTFSKDGQTWAAPQPVMEKGDWLWRVTWHKGRAYGVSYVTPAKGDWIVKLAESTDGVNFRVLTQWEVPGQPNEATVRFLKNDEAVVLLRREAQDKAAWIGTAHPPYRDWQWQSSGMQVGGPNFLVLPQGQMIAGGRQYNPKPAGAKMFVGEMTRDSVRAQLVLPSGGDCSYPGLVWHQDMLWASYYSSHEKRTSIYLAKIKLPKD